MSVKPATPTANGQVVTRKPRGANKPKPEVFAFNQNGDAFTLTLGTVTIPLDLANIQTIIWQRIMAGGTVQVTFTKQ